MKEPKDNLVKARVTKRMKDAVSAAAATKGDGGEAEAIILREALGEYLGARGYLKAPRTTEEPPAYVTQAGKAARKFTGGKKKQPAARSRAAKR